MMKPILFNTNMVKALLDGRKTVTRRCVKPQPQFRKGETGTPEILDDGNWTFKIDQYNDIYDFDLKAPFYKGDILYVRETWAELPYGYVYRADDEKPEGWDHKDRWSPSIHMPKEAARIFLRVTDVRVERLQDITPEQIDAEGCKEYVYGGKSGDLLPSSPSWFCIIWDSTIKPADLPTYGWDANPWVWVIEFERCKKPEDTDNE